ncbi:Response regulator PleD [Aquisphaera giovannonii]|uniref:diguanylate cyclase n=1 Tax=Aquisphaera giovannonii TaxID=406548 RepID=A0A5B9VUN3_9BACT|nr:diguanylate cyclase [Aquisphaera giovannonii]QEH31794.1 Response regulator PleD [Aquisphaera giovannonii]
MMIEAHASARPDADMDLKTRHRPAAGPVPRRGPYAEPERMMDDLDPVDLPRKVLLIEPCRDEQAWLRNELAGGQMEVYTAADLITARRAVSLFRPNLILAQLRLPTHGGLELVRLLKGDAETRPIPVILYADLATADERVLALDLGAADVVTRPFAAAELIARVRAAIRARHLVEILEARAHIDALTGLANRGLLEDRLPREWEGCRRRGQPLSILMADLDHFKSINDTYGHAAGDEVLRRAAAAMAHSVRVSDLVARYGGEEFVVVAPDCGPETAIDLAERFRLAVAALRIVEHGVPIPVTASVGVASVVADDLDDATPAALLKRADDALYHAKQSGRNATYTNHPTRGMLLAPAT